MKDLNKLYRDYGYYHLNYNQLNLESPSIAYSWYKTKKILENEATKVIKNLIHQGNKNILVADFGCGNGAFLIRLAKKFEKFDVFFNGFDLSSDFVNFGVRSASYKKLKNIVFKELDFEKDEWPKNYDLIISSEVIEHLTLPKKFIAQVLSSLKQKGKFLLTSPNSQNILKYPFYYLKKIINISNERSIKQYLTTEEVQLKLGEDEQHIYVYPHKELNKTLIAAGFEVYKTPRGSSFFGGEFFDTKPLLLGLALIIDSFFDLIKFSSASWDNIFFCTKR